MVANIRSGSSPGGALRYNKEKVDKDEAEVLFWQKMLEPFDRYGRMDVNAYMESFIRVWFHFQSQVQNCLLWP